MWIASSLGYFSIVKKADKYYVRARNSQDLKLLNKAAGIDAEIYIFAGTDYAARIIIDAETLWKVQDALFDSIDYDNFKDSIHDNPEQVDKLGYYTRVWGIMLNYQLSLTPDYADYERPRPAKKRKKTKADKRKAYNSYGKLLKFNGGKLPF